MEVKELRLQSLQLLLQEDTGPERGRKRRLATRTKKHPAQISQWLSGYRSIDEDSARSIETSTGKPRGWMDEQHCLDSQHAFAGPETGVGVSPLAHQLSHPSQIIAPTTIAWEQLMSGPLPPFFQAVLPDDSMGIDYPKGCTVNFTTEGLPARARDLVLVADADGQVYFREFQQGRGDRWQAVAWLSGYSPLDSEDDGLRVIAISMGRWGRRG